MVDELPTLRVQLEKVRGKAEVRVSLADSTGLAALPGPVQILTLTLTLTLFLSLTLFLTLPYTIPDLITDPDPDPQGAAKHFKREEARFQG